VGLLLNTATGQNLRRRLPRRQDWWVPEHYYEEVGAAFRRAKRRGDVTTPEVTAVFGEMVTAPVQRIPIRSLLEEAWAHRGHLTIGVALYVVLAQRLGGMLATTDDRLATTDDRLATTDDRLANASGLAVSTITGQL